MVFKESSCAGSRMSRTCLCKRSQRAENRSHSNSWQEYNSREALWGLSHQNRLANMMHADLQRGSRVSCHDFQSRFVAKQNGAKVAAKATRPSWRGILSLNYTTGRQAAIYLNTLCLGYITIGHFWRCWPVKKKSVKAGFPLEQVFQDNISAFSGA